MNFTGKVVIVTGSSSGIGAATAKLFAENGAQVVINGRNENKLSTITSEIAKVGKVPFVVKADISKDDDAKRLINDTIEKFGRIDVLVNNAGFAREGSILDGRLLQTFDEMMPTNLRAVVHLTSLSAPHLIKTKGNIVNILSIGATIAPGIPTLNIYHVSKAALKHFTRCAALELAEYKVRVNSVTPGPVFTDFIKNANINIKIDDLAADLPLKRVAQPEEIADIIMMLASEKSIGITGSDFVADSGFLLNH